MCVWFSEFHFLFFENLVFNFVVYVCVLKGLLSLLLLVALLGMAAKMDYISPTVCVHCFQLFYYFCFPFNTIKAKCIRIRTKLSYSFLGIIS